MSTDRVIIQRGAAERLILRLMEILKKVEAGVVGRGGLISTDRAEPVLKADPEERQYRQLYPSDFVEVLSALGMDYSDT